MVKTDFPDQYSINNQRLAYQVGQIDRDYTTWLWINQDAHFLRRIKQRKGRNQQETTKGDHKKHVH